jgi:hypothetical protein
MRSINVKISCFTGYWIVPKSNIEKFKETALSIPRTNGIIFDEFAERLRPLAEEYVSVGEIARQWREWNYNIPEFGSNNFPKNDASVVIDIQS